MCVFVINDKMLNMFDILDVLWHDIIRLSFIKVVANWSYGNITYQWWMKKWLSYAKSSKKVITECRDLKDLSI